MYDILKKRFAAIVKQNNLGSESVKVVARTLTAEEAIGNPEETDYPLQKGKERLIEAEFMDSRGQAFTDMFGNYQGKLSQIIEMDLSNNFRRAIFVATINAVMRHLGMVDKTIHCKDSGPKQCSRELVDYIKKKFNKPRVALVGLQPRMLESLVGEFEVRATDLDTNNVGREKFGIVIDSPEKTGENLSWCDLAMATGTTLVNNTIITLDQEKPVIFFGISIAGPAHLLGLTHFCPCST